MPNKDSSNKLFMPPVPEAKSTSMQLTLLSKLISLLQKYLLFNLQSNIEKLENKRVRILVAIDKSETSLKEPKTWGLTKKNKELIESNINRVKIREKKIYDAKKCLLEYELARLYPSSEKNQTEINNLQQEIRFYELRTEREKIVQTLVKILIGCNYSYPAKKVNREI